MTFICLRSTTPIELSCAFRSEEHTSELQSRLHLECRLLLEKNNEDTLMELGSLIFDMLVNYGLFSFCLVLKFYVSVVFHLFEPNTNVGVVILKTLALYPELN